MINFFRKLLLPVVPLYYLGALINKKLFDYQIRKSHQFTIPIITVGNLSVGGTGKSPMVGYIIELLKQHYPVATLSRGYKRKQKGFLEVEISNTALEVGDEPLQFKCNYPDVMVAVDENRKNGIETMINYSNPPEVIVLDDAYQHRQVQAGMQILLTSYDDLYVDDIMLPTGNLREPKSGAERANLIVVTKCPENLNIKKKEAILNNIRPQFSQSVYFSYIKYSDLIIGNEVKLDIDIFIKDRFTLVTGIANPLPLVAYLKRKEADFDHISFPDHHNFTANELEELSRHSKILTTEKDYMRLKNVVSLKSKLYYLSIKCDFIDGKEEFNNEILNFCDKQIKSRT